jgi:hypothetical protein
VRKEMKGIRKALQFFVGFGGWFMGKKQWRAL